MYVRKQLEYTLSMILEMQGIYYPIYFTGTYI